MPAYDDQFDPPAPMARVTLRNPETGQIIPEVLMLLDTGADVSLVPASAARNLGVQLMPSREIRLVGYNDAASVPDVAICKSSCLPEQFRDNSRWSISYTESSEEIS